MPPSNVDVFSKQTALFIAGYAILFLGMEYTTSLHDVMAGRALWYPGAGLHLALGVLIGYISIPVILVVSLLSSILINVPGTQLVVPSIIAALGYGVGAGWLRKQLRTLHPAGPDASENFVYVATAIPALVAAGTLAWWVQFGESPVSSELSFRALIHGWFGATIGISTITPPILLLLWVRVQPWIESVTPGQYFGWALDAEARKTLGIQVLAILLGLVIAFSAPTEDVLYEVCFFPVLWMAYRNRLSRASLGVLLTIVGCVLMSALWRPVTSILEFQVFALALFISGALLGVLTSERQRAFRALQRLGAEDHLADIERAAASVDEVSIDADVEAIMKRLKRMRTDSLQYHLEGLLALKSLLSRDLSELESRTEHLESLHEQKDAFFANLSHEFQTPLTLIIGTLYRTRNGAYGQPTPLMEEQISVMLRNAGRLRRLVDHILDLARLESGQMELEAGRYNIVDFAREVTLSFESSAEQQDISLTFESYGDDIQLYFQPEYVEKILGNLISNAIKFTPSGEQVVVSLRDEGPSLAIQVRDSGPGISKDDEPFIFDRFYQVDSPSLRIAGSTGLGLAVAKELVELHGGEISLDTSEGEGSTFIVHFRKGCRHLSSASIVSDDDRDVTARSAHKDEQRLALWHPSYSLSRAENSDNDTDTSGDIPSPLNGDGEEDQKTVLVVDDNRDLRQFVRHIMEPTYKVLEAVDGADGLEKAASLLPDLIVADVMMPRMDGFEMNERLKEERATECIPVIFLTARDMIDDQVKGLVSGGDGYITKPFDSDILRARAIGILKQRERLRERFEEGKVGPDELGDPEEKESISPFEQRVRDAVRKHIADGDFTVEMLADEVALSRRQLSRKLKDEVGTTPARFIREERLKKAAQLLKNDAGNISEIAYAVGFNSLSYFSRCFREHFEVTPSEYASNS